MPPGEAVCAWPSCAPPAHAPGPGPAHLTGPVDSADDLDPHGHDGPLSDEYPRNPESVGYDRDETPPIVIDAAKHVELAKEGSPGPDNPDARDADSCMDEALHGTESLMHLLAHSRPSGIKFKGHAAKARGVDDSEESGVRGPEYDAHLAFTTQRYDERDANIHGLTMEGVLRELQAAEAKDRLGQKCLLPACACPDTPSPRCPHHIVPAEQGAVPYKHTGLPYVPASCACLRCLPQMP